MEPLARREREPAICTHCGKPITDLKNHDDYGVSADRLYGFERFIVQSDQRG
jgi:hypothetical protein